MRKLSRIPELPVIDPPRGSNNSAAASHPFDFEAQLAERMADPEWVAKWEAPETFGKYLKRVRRERRLSLRAVEKITGGKVSNGYLSQIEGGQIEVPGVLILHRLAGAYAIDFADLCERACVGHTKPVPPPTCPTCGHPLFEGVT